MLALLTKHRILPSLFKHQRILMSTLNSLKPTDFMNNPHPHDIITHEQKLPPWQNKKILNNVLETIGNTPLIRLNNIPQSYGLKCEILVKCEYFNPTGSIKDRIVIRMLNDAEKQGRIKEDNLLVEPSSGNTGISLGVIAGLKGYNVIVTGEDKNEGEKTALMKALGLKVILTPSGISWESPDSYFSLAEDIRKAIPGAKTLNQYDCISNALANYDTTGEEILEACEGKLDYLVFGVRTGGTTVGITAKVKGKLPKCKVVGVDPEGSIIAPPHDKHPKAGQKFKTEGIGHDFIPNTCVEKWVDEWVKVGDKEGFEMARRLVREEGLLIGGSSGSAVLGAINYAKENKLDERHRVVVILPDSVRNYMTKYLSDHWMVNNGYLGLETFLDKKHKLYGRKVNELKPSPIKTYETSMTVKEAIKVFKGGENVIVLEEKGKIKGVIYEEDVIASLNADNKLEDKLEKVPPRGVQPVDFETDLSIVAKLFEKDKVVIVENKKGLLAGLISSKYYKLSPVDVLALNI